MSKWLGTLVLLSTFKLSQRKWKICVDFAQLDQDPDPHFKYGSGSNRPKFMRIRNTDIYIYIKFYFDTVNSANFDMGGAEIIFFLEIFLGSVYN
jgi:hypothetical protein